MTALRGPTRPPGRDGALRTRRLVLTPVAPDDAGALLALFNEPVVGRYLLDGKHVARAWVESEIADSRARFADGGPGLWGVRVASASSAAAQEGGVAGEEGEAAVVDREAAPGEGGTALIGVVGFRPFFDPPELQLLYALHPDVWGRGLATEAAGAALSHVFEELGFDEVRAATDEPNQASVAVMERLGMERWQSEPGRPHDTVFFRLARAAWQARRTASTAF